MRIPSIAILTCYSLASRRPWGRPRCVEDTNFESLPIDLRPGPVLVAMQKSPAEADTVQNKCHIESETRQHISVQASADREPHDARGTHGS